MPLYSHQALYFCQIRPDFKLCNHAIHPNHLNHPNIQNELNHLVYLNYPNTLITSTTPTPKNLNPHHPNLLNLPNHVNCPNHLDHPNLSALLVLLPTNKIVTYNIKMN